METAGARHGLYEWLVPPPQAHMTSICIPHTTWHKRIGHPHARVLRFILNRFSLKFLEREKHFHCNSFLSNKAH